MSKLLTTTAIAAGMALWGSTAFAATTLYVGLQETGVAGGAITLIDHGPSVPISGLQTGAESYGTFSFATIQGFGTPPQPVPNLDLVVSSVTNSADGIPPFSSGTIHVWLTETGLTTPTGTLNLVTTWSATMQSGILTFSSQAYADDADGIFTTSIPLNAPASATLGTAGTANSASDSGNANSTATITPTGAPVTVGGNPTYSETVEFTIAATNAACNGPNSPGNLCWDASGATNLNTVNIPEPASLSLLGGGLLAFGAWRRRRHQKS